MDAMRERMTALERSVRRQRSVLGVIGTAMVLAVALGTGQPPAPITHDLVRARRVEIVNEAGVPVAVLASGPAGGIVSIQSPSGQLLVTLTATPDGVGAVAVAGPKGERLVECSGRPGGSGAVTVFNPTGDPAVSVLSSRGGGVIQAFNSQKHPAAMLGSASDEGVIAVFDAAGMVRQTMPPDRK